VAVAVEPRHPSWWTAPVRHTLERHGAALCWADRLGRPVTPLWRTADFGYLRLHQGADGPYPGYRPAALRAWLDRLVAAFVPELTGYVYFNNDPGGAAVADAYAFTAWCRRQGVAVGRTTARAHPLPPRTGPTGPTGAA